MISPRDLARAIGVGESSVKRWVDEGRLAGARTSGGHRRIAQAEAIRFVRELGLEVARPDLLGLHGGSSGEDRAPSAEALEAALLAADGNAARRMLVSAFVSGTSVAALCDGPIGKVLHDLGESWEETPTGIGAEHHAVDACLQALMEIRSLIDPPGTGPLAIGGAVQSDPYILPSLMTSIVLAEAGYRTINLGPNIPARALGATVLTQKPDLVWRSASIPLRGKALRDDLLEALPASVVSAEMVIGGRGLPRFRESPGPAIHVLQSMQDLYRFARDRVAARAD
jgi:excisionase family DNA binding protein